MLPLCARQKGTELQGRLNPVHSNEGRVGRCWRREGLRQLRGFSCSSSLLQRPPPTAILEEGDSPCLSKLLYLMADVNAHILLRVNQGLNTFCRKGCVGRRAHTKHRALSRHLISMENSWILGSVTSVMVLSVGCHGYMLHMFTNVNNYSPCDEHRWYQ